jgi:uncharacterized protein
MISRGDFMGKKHFRIIDLILPREVFIYKHLNEQVNIFVEACEEFGRLVHGLDRLTDAERRKIATRIKSLETSGDIKERKIIEELDDVFILPLDREDIHSIVQNIDNAIDLLHEVTQRMITHDIKKKSTCLVTFSDSVLEAGRDLKQLVYSIETRNRSAELIAKIHKVENKSDELFNQCMIELFKNKDPMEVLKYKDIYELLEELVDAIDSVAKLIRGVLVKQG